MELEVLAFKLLVIRGITNLKHLGQTMYHSVFNFNCIRPYGALLGLTPAESYNGKTVDIYREKQLMKEASEARLSWNRIHNCQGCPFGCN